MTNREIENSINRAVSCAVPDVRASVLTRCEEQKGKIIVMTEKKRTRRWAARVAGMAAALMLLVGGAQVYRANYAVASTVSLDVNPSIEIKVNRSEKVLAVVPLNEDGRIVVGNMDFEGSGLELTVNALIGSMLKNGYLSDMANSILISVDSADPAAGERLQTELTAEINALLQTDQFSGAVLSQTVEPDSQLQQLADAYGITAGKAQLIRQICSQDTRYTFEDLVSLSINELNLLSESGSVRLENVESVGIASNKGYIGEAAAKAAALNHAGVEEKDISGYEFEMGYEHGSMVYEIEFICGGYEYEYDIDAATGAVIKQERETHRGTSETQSHHTHHTQQTDDTTVYIGETAALEAALEHAGVSEDDISRYKCKLDREDGLMVYEIEFTCAGYEYEYEISADDGSVVKYERERDN